MAEIIWNGRCAGLKDDKAFVEWLESIDRPAYQTACRDSFVRFLDFLKENGWEDPSATEIIQRHYENRKRDNPKEKFYFDDLLPKFLDWLKAQGIQHNSAVTMTTHIRGFFKFHREPLRIQRGKLVYVEKAKKYHVFRHRELCKMVRVADPEEKAIILLGVCEGIRVGDFIKQKRQPLIEAFEDQNEFPFEVEVETEKEGVVAVVHVTEEAWVALQDYWGTVPESEYVFPNKTGKGHLSEDRINDALKAAWRKAFPDRPDVKIRFHELRSYKMSALSDAGVNRWHIKRMVGKKLGPDIATYLKGVDLRKDFLKAIEKFALTGVVTNHDRLKQLEDLVIHLQKEVRRLKLQNELLIDRLARSGDDRLIVLAHELRMVWQQKT